jgi:hypothetical protein
LIKVLHISNTSAISNQSNQQSNQQLQQKMSTTKLFDLPYDIILAIGGYLDIADTVSFYLYSRLERDQALSDKKADGDIVLRTESAEKVSKAYHGWKRSLGFSCSSNATIGDWLAADYKTSWLQPYLAPSRLLVQKAACLFEASTLLLQKMPVVKELGAFEPADTLNGISKIDSATLELLPRDILLEKILPPTLTFSAYERIITDYQSPLIVAGEKQYNKKQYKRYGLIQKNPYIMKHVQNRILTRVKRNPSKNLHQFYLMLINDRILPGYFDLDLFKSVCADTCMPLTCLLKQLVNLADYLRNSIYERADRRKHEIKEALTKKINTITKVVKVIFDEILFDKDVREVIDLLQDIGFSEFKAQHVIDLVVAAIAAVESGGTPYIPYVTYV